MLYRRQVIAEGVDVTTYGPLKLSYRLPNGDEVMAFSDDQLHPEDPTGFSITVTPPGG